MKFLALIGLAFLFGICVASVSQAPALVLPGKNKSVVKTANSTAVKPRRGAMEGAPQAGPRPLKKSVLSLKKGGGAVSNSKNGRQGRSPAQVRRKPARFEGHNIKILRLKDYEEMRDLLHVYIRDSRAVLPEDGIGGGDIAVMELKNGLKLLFMRPNTDSLLNSLVPVLQNEIIKYRSFMSVLRELVRESAQELKAEKASVSHQAGLLYLLENSLAYTQSINNPGSKALLKEIEKADITISRKLSRWLTLEMGRGRVQSPSRLAGNILRQRQAREKSRRRKAQAGIRKKGKRHPAGKQNPSSGQTEDSPPKIINLY